MNPGSLLYFRPETASPQFPSQASQHLVRSCSDAGRVNPIDDLVCGADPTGIVNKTFANGKGSIMRTIAPSACRLGLTQVEPVQFLSRFSQSNLPRAICLGVLGVLLIQSAPASAITQLATVKVGRGPGPIAVNPSAHLVYVVNQSANTVAVLDSQLLTVKKTILVGKMPVAIAVNPVANMVYVANSGAGTISAITSTQAAVTWTVGGKPIALAVDSALKKLFVADAFLKRVKILDSTKGTLLATISTGAQPAAITLNIATHDVFVACTGSSGSVVVIDGNTNEIVTTVAGLPAGITSISSDPVTNVAVLVSPTASSATAVAVIDAATSYSLQFVPGDPGADPIATAYDAGGFFFIGDSGDGNIFFADGTGVVTLGNDYQTHLAGLSALAMNPATNQMGALYSSLNTLYIIDLLSPLFTSNYHELTTGKTPAGLAFDPITSRVFVANSGDNTVSVFDISPRSIVPAYEGNYINNGIEFNFMDINPATGTVYTLRLGNLFAINESQAAKGSTGLGKNSAGVTAIPLGSTSSGAVAVNAATNKIYAGDGAGLFYSVNGATNVATILTALPITANIESIAINSAADQVLAWDATSDSLFVLDSATDTLLNTVPLGSSAQTGFVVADPTRSLGYVGTSSLYVVDPTAGTVVTSIVLSGTTVAMALNPLASRLYVATNKGEVYVIDTTLNSVDLSFKPPFQPLDIGVNPITGNYYVTAANGAGGSDVYVYSGSTNNLIIDLPSSLYPELLFATNLAINPLTDTVYVGSEFENNSAGIGAIDGRTNVVSALPLNLFDSAAYLLQVDLGSGALAGAGYSYTSLWLPTSDLSGSESEPIAVTMVGVKDSSTIATTPLFRTHNSQPKFTITATSNFSENASALVPKHGFFQVDGWQGTWTAATLTAPVGSVTSTATVKLPVLKTGQHVLYSYASTGDVSTVQSGITGANSPVVSPVASVVFTVEQ